MSSKECPILFDTFLGTPFIATQESHRLLTNITDFHSAPLALPGFILGLGLSSHSTDKACNVSLLGSVNSTIMQVKSLA